MALAQMHGPASTCDGSESDGSKGDGSKCDGSGDTGPTQDNRYGMPDPRTYAWFFDDWLRDGRRSAKVALVRAGLTAELYWRSGNGQIWLEIRKLKVRKEWRRRGVATRYFHVLAQAVGSLGLVVRATVPEDNVVFAAWAKSLVASGLAVQLDEPGTVVESTWLRHSSRRPLRILCR
jgi:hypothetical protein